MEQLPIWLVLIISVLAIGFAYFLIQNVLKRDAGTPEMQTISNAIKEGAEAFLKRQNTTIGYLALVVAVVLGLLYAFLRPESKFDPLARTPLAIWTVVAFILGAACSVSAGYIGMWISIRTNIRTASAATKSLNGALQTALRGGAVAGLFVVAMCLLGITVLFYAVRLVHPDVSIANIPLVIIGFAFGASFVALFAQLGGGIYTKAADVGADLVGKVEAGIPEDDPRNPAVIADLVGDNVGDCAGRGADLFESTAAENIGALILGASLFAANAKIFAPSQQLGVILFPLVVSALCIIASIIGVMIVKTKEDTKNPMQALNFGYYVTAIGAFFLFGGACYWLLNPHGPTGATTAQYTWVYFWACGTIGLLTSVAFLFITQYYTESDYRPVQSIANASVTGPATNIISGIAVGLECVAMPIIVIGVALITSYLLGEASGLKDAGLFGTAVATIGMLGTAGYVLAMDTFGPITDNAGGIVEMSNQPDEVREKTDKLDSVGNTTKALTKGYAVGSAALASFLLFSAYLDEVRHYGAKIASVDLTKPVVFVGAMLGAMLVFLFASLAIRAVGKAAQVVIEDVRDQFKNDPGILAGTSKPNYGRTVDIVTKSALREMVLPGILAVCMPIVVGLVFKTLYNSMGANRTASSATGAEGVAGFLMVATIVGILMALFLNNAGGAWDNAKKFIETGQHGGKGSDAHKAAVVGDTVGDPFKDTAGPSLHVLIKLLATITLVLAPFFI